MKYMASIYCTIFDSNYVARALTLYMSFVEFNRSGLFAFVCIDDAAAEILALLSLPRSLILSPRDYVTPALKRVEPTRSRGEYCWTCKPVVLLHLMDRFPEASWVVYLDTDMMLFDDPDSALPGEAAHYLLTPHRFHSSFSQFAADAGIYNAGYMAARNTSQGREVIAWWQQRCLESCSVELTPETYADQKYLNRLPDLFPWGNISTHIGLNAAPWNIAAYGVTRRDGKVYIDDTALVLYHFQALHVFHNGTATLYAGGWRLPDPLRKFVYEPHLQRIADAYALLRAKDAEFALGLSSPPAVKGGFLSRCRQRLQRRRNLVRFTV
jgi:hypothetical protein